MKKRIIVELKERPSFEGELNIRVTAEPDSPGKVKYALVCQKNPPLNEELLDDGSGISDTELEQIWAAICWQRELSSSEVGEITSLLQHEVVSILPEPLFGLDGTRYELLIESGIDRVQFSWWEESASGWKPLRNLSMMLLRMADAARMIEALQSNERKEIIKRLRQRGYEEGLLQAEANRRLVSENNSRGRELARRAEFMGITCPRCKQHSRDVRFIDNCADAKAYFICGLCWRSFFPTDV